MEKGLEEEEDLEEEGPDAEGHDMVFLGEWGLEESGLGEAPEEEGHDEDLEGEGIEEDSEGEGIEEDPEGEGLVEEGYEEGMQLSYYAEAAVQSLLLVAGAQDASSEGVAPSASSVGAWVAHGEEGGVGLALEGNAACVVAVGLEDAGVASDQALRRADHWRASGFQEGHQGEDLVVHQPGCLREA